MKRIAKIIVIFFFLTTGTNAVAQNTNSDIAIDPRIANHYSQEQIEDLKNNLSELKKLNYYFQNSFIVVPANIPNAEPIDLMSIDARRFEDKRQVSERTTIIISKNDDQLILKSKEELEKEYKLIK